MSVIDEFLTKYHREIDYYEQVARIASNQAKAQLEAAGIRAIVTDRAKSPDRLAGKVKDRNRSKNYQSVQEIQDDIVDLAGVRIALYFPKDREEADRIITSQFDLTEPPKKFPEEDVLLSYKKRFSGYWATHYRVKLQVETLQEAHRRYADAVVEVQVASVLMHAWAEVEHDLVYKPFQGKLSEEEYAILDELNGLVLVGEIALERLQGAMERRLSQTKAEFGNHFDLAGYLHSRLSEKLGKAPPDWALGRVDLLFDFMRALDIARPEEAEELIGNLHEQFEKRPISEQLIDFLLAQDQERYSVYSEIRNRRERTRIYTALLLQEGGTEQEAAIGDFITKWIQLEVLLREKGKKSLEGKHSMTPSNVLYWIRKLPERDGTLLDQLRRIRNNLVHGVEIPEVSYLRSAAKDIKTIIAAVRAENQG